MPNLLPNLCHFFCVLNQSSSRPVIFRSHIQVRADLADEHNSPTAGVWNWVWDNVKECDAFISHPVREFVPKNVTTEKVR